MLEAQLQQMLVASLLLEAQEQDLDLGDHSAQLALVLEAPGKQCLSSS